MYLRWILVGLLLCAGVATAAEQADTVVEAHGAHDASVPGWTIATVAPIGWTKDCCTYASAIGVNYVLYQGEWTGKPNRVMVLNVWPSKLPTLDAELQDDRKHYLQLDPAGKVASLPVNNPHMPCRGVLYSGSDHIDDAIVFCDPGKTAGIRYSWSVAIGAMDPMRQQLLKLFKEVAEHSSYATFVPPSHSTGKPAAH
jgi:hypothetical protein